MDKFTSILKQTHERICELKKIIIGVQSNADVIFAFSKLISVMSQYLSDTWSLVRSKYNMMALCHMSKANRIVFRN